MADLAEPYRKRIHQRTPRKRINEAVAILAAAAIPARQPMSFARIIIT